MIRNLIYIFISTLIFSFTNIFSQQYRDSSSVNTILQRQETKTTLQLIQDENKKSLEYKESELPKSENVFTPEQDSMFYQMLRLNLPINVIVSNNLIYTDDLWKFGKQISEGTPWQYAIMNIRDIPAEFYNPSPIEMVHRQTMIENSFEIPFLATYQRHGFKFTTESIANLFGLTEDLSPKITYSLDYTTNVEVVVYSISSTVVSTLFEGKQTPGSYSLTWNGRDSYGKLMPAGNYIAEVRIGNEKYIRKRIEIK